MTGQRSKPDEDPSVYEAVIWLRLELLNAAIGYGIYAALSEGGTATVSEWRECLDWAEGVVSTIREQAGEAPREMPGWLRQAIEAIDSFEELGAQPTDLFEDEAVRHWATEEFELLAVLARPIEQADGEPLGEIEDRPSRAGMRLLAAIQDSLVIASAEDQTIRDKRASAAEIYADLVATREEGVWEAFLGA